MPFLPPLYSHKKPPEKLKKKSSRFYDTRRWRKLSARHRREEPLCRQCFKRGIITAGVLTDHIIPILEGGAEWDNDNLQTLCDRCHQIKRQGEKVKRAQAI